MDADDFLNFIIIPTTKIIGLQSKSSDILMLGTAIIESDLVWLEQKGPGQGFGVYSIESATHKDVHRYLNRLENKRLKDACLCACLYEYLPSSNDTLIYNLRYATIIARIKYWMRPEPLPSPDDAQGFANYHKKFYNTPQGKTDVNASVKVFERLIGES